MALAQRSRADIEKFVANTAAYSEVVHALNNVPILTGEDLRQMIDRAASIDLSAIVSASDATPRLEVEG